MSFRVIHFKDYHLIYYGVLQVLNEINCPVKNGYWLFCLFYLTQLCLLLTSWGYLGHFILQRVYTSFENRYFTVRNRMKGGEGRIENIIRFRYQLYC